MTNSVVIRPAMIEDATAIERLYNQSAAYLRALGDTTDFQFDAQVYRRDGFGQSPAFQGIVALVDEQMVGYLLTKTIMPHSPFISGWGRKKFKICV